MCIQRDNFIMDLSEDEIFEGIEGAIKNVASHADVLYFESIDQKKHKQLLSDILILSMYYEAYFKKECTVFNKALLRKSDNKERKNTGSFFTPPYIAEYICRETIMPLIKRPIKCDLETLIENIYSLKICDPAMGGGIFLICAHDFLVDTLCGLGEPPDTSARKAVKCIYGIDINSDMVEVSKILLNLNIMKWEIKSKIKEFVSSVV